MSQKKGKTWRSSRSNQFLERESPTYSEVRGSFANTPQHRELLQRQEGGLRAFLPLDSFHAGNTCP
jgi:hypothetical protein